MLRAQFRRANQSGKSAGSEQRLTALANVFSLGNSEGYKFETVLCSILIADACRKVKGLRRERNLQMYRIPNFQLGSGSNAGATFCQVDCTSIDISGRISFRYADPDTLMELKSGKAPLRRKRHIFHCSHPVD